MTQTASGWRFEAAAMVVVEGVLSFASEGVSSTSAAAWQNGPSIYNS